VSRFSLNSLLEDLGASARVRTPPLYFPPGHASHEHASAGQWIGLRGALLQSGWMLPDGRTRRLSDGYHYYREFANHLFDAAFAADSAFERREWVSEDGRVAMLLERTRDWRDPEIEDAHRFLIGIDPDDLRHYQDFADFWIQRAAGSARARAWQRITRAVGLLGQGDRPAADRAARRALAADPSEPVARWLSVELADPPPSASALIQSIDGCEFWPPLWFEVAARLSEIDQRDAACRVFAQLVRTDRLAVPRPEQLARVTRAAEPCPESEILALRRKRRGHAHRAAAAREGAIYLEWGRAIFAFESYREAALADVRDEQSLEAVDRALAQIPAQRASEFERQREILELELSALRNAGVWSWGVAH